MARVLAISSQVARGHIGLSAIVPVLHALGHEVVALPTVVLSNHPGHAHAAGTRIEAPTLREMLQALDRNGWLAGIDAVLSGYLPTAEHGRLVEHAVGAARARNERCLYLCDPVLGDDPKGLYIPEAAAVTIRERLVPMADCVSPNRFELAWLTGKAVDGVGDAICAARALAAGIVFATSIPADASRGELANLRVQGSSAMAIRVRRLEQVPNGTGDMMSALILAAILEGRGAEMQLVAAVSGVEAAIAASRDCDELALVASRATWSAPPHIEVERL